MTRRATSAALGLAAFVGGYLVADVADAAYPAGSTAYCLTGTMADGTGVRAGSAASNRHPLGQRIYIRGAGGPGGRRRWTIRDRIGHGSDLDFWLPSCGAALAWGRRSVTYRLGWPRPRARWSRPSVHGWRAIGLRRLGP